MDRRQIEFFLAICEAGSLSRAAQTLGVSQSAVSQSIRRLEDDLGVVLLNRSREGVALTDAGRALVPAAADIVRSFEVAHATVPSTSGVRVGSLRASCPTSMVLDPFAGLLLAFRARHPEVRIRALSPRTALDSVEHVLSGYVDFALLSGGLANTGIATELVTRQSIVAIVPPALAQEPGDLGGLLSHGLLAEPSGEMIRHLVEEAAGRGLVERSVVVQTDLQGSTIRLVAAGIGIAFMPYEAALRATPEGVHIIRPEPALTREIHIGYRPDHRSGNLEELLTVVRASREGDSRIAAKCDE